MDLSDLNLSNSAEDDIGYMFFTDNSFSFDSTDQEDNLFSYFLETNANLSIEIKNTHEICTNSEKYHEKDNPQSQFHKNTEKIMHNQLMNQQSSNYFPKKSENSEGNSKSIALTEETNSRGSTRASQRKVALSRKANDFKKLFYQFFTSKKRFSKYLVKQIHDIMIIPCQLKKMTREEFRRIDLYFQNYAQFSDRILIYLHKHKEELLEEIPELSNLN